MDIVLQVGVKVLLKNGEGEYLLVGRNLEKYKDVGEERWDCVGGRINPGTSLLENLNREVYEETKLDLVSSPKLLGAQDILRVPGKHVVRLTYVADIVGEPELDKSENLEYKWFTLRDMLNNPVVDRYLRDLLGEIELPI
jgi:ADP-ribose pyrophosphatase YjhB (NUDIX family)